MRQFFRSIFSLIYSWLSRPDLILKRANLLELELSGDMVDIRPRFSFLQKYMARMPGSFTDMIFALKEAESDPNIKACLLKIGSSSLGWGRASELRESIQRFRSFGKKAVGFLEETGNLEYYIATACDEIIMAPSQSLNLIGLMSEVLYFKGILDKLSIKPELLHAGKYKSAVEPYTRDSMSPEHREAVDAILDDIFRELSESIAQNRNLAPEKIKELIDSAPHLPEEAVTQGLVDKVLYSDQVDERIERLLGEPIRRINSEQYYRLRRARLRSLAAFRKAPMLALIYASGVIEQSDDREYQELGESITPERMLDALRAVRENPHIKAAVLRVDSPGGSAVASDLIWREVNLLRKAKPLIVSMGDVAASGGYYIAMPGEKILAQPCTLTGSIGVIAGKLNLRGLYNKFGLKKEQLKRGEHADLYSDYTDLAGSKGEKMAKEIGHFYEKFVQKAADARKMNWEEMDSRAQGRVWTGKQALALGLIDGFGGLRSAIDLAKQSIGLRPEDRVVFEIHPRPKMRFLPMFPFRIPNIPFLDGRESRLVSRLARLARDKILLLMPFIIRIK